MEEYIDFVSDEEVDKIKRTLEDIADDFGDVLVIQSRCWQGNIIKMFVGKYNHTAIKIRENLAESISNDGRERYSLHRVPNYWMGFDVLRHKDIKQSDRNAMKAMNDILSTEYDYKLLLNLAMKHLLGYEKREQDLSHEGKFNCDSRIGFMYDRRNLPVMEGVHWSQLYPVDFLNSPHFVNVRHWKRNI